MGLINLKTDLKDLKFGHDRYKWGSSKEPYIQTRVPATDEPLQTSISLSGDNVVEGLGFALLGAGAGALFGGAGGAALGTGLGIATAVATQGLQLQLQTPTSGTGGPDFLLRGGTLLSTALANDAIRLSKFFSDTRGVLFTIKQNLLSRAGIATQGAPRLLNERLYTPFSTILGATGNAFGLHVNKQGLNPFLGLGETFVPDRYLTALANEITSTNTDPGNIFKNRLYGLYSAKLLTPTSTAESPLYNIFFKNNNISTNSDILLSYGGGPNSFLGIGKTNIRYATNNVGASLSVRDSKAVFQDPNFLNHYATLNYQQLSEVTTDTVNIENGLNSNPLFIGNYIRPKVIDFRQAIKDQLLTDNLSSKSPSYDVGKRKTLETRTSLGDPGYLSLKNIESYTDGDNSVGIYSTKGVLQPGGGKGAASEFSSDDINAYGINNELKENDPLPFKDLVTFKIEVIDPRPDSNKTQIWFRAFLDQISDSYNSNWDPTKYVGRGENFYTYSGFDRKISLGWTVAAQSKIELMQMYRKLNYLASVCAPNYSDSGYMQGNIITLTIGGYIFEQPGIMTGFNYEMNDENDTWEIAINDEGNEDNSIKQLPHIIRVRGFNFIPIHKFVPKIQKYTTNANGILEYTQERFIALENRQNNNWIMGPSSTPTVEPRVNPVAT